MPCISLCFKGLVWNFIFLHIWLLRYYYPPHSLEWVRSPVSVFDHGWSCKRFKPYPGAISELAFDAYVFTASSSLSYSKSDWHIWCKAIKRKEDFSKDGHSYLSEWECSIEDTKSTILVIALMDKEWKWRGHKI